MLSVILKYVFISIILLVAPVTNVWLLIQDQTKIFMLLSCITTFVGIIFMTTTFKFISFLCFMGSLVCSSFQFGTEMPLPNQRFVLMVLNIIAIIFYASLNFCSKTRKLKIRQKEIEIYKVDILTGKRLDNL